MLTCTNKRCAVSLQDEMARNGVDFEQAGATQLEVTN